MVSHANEKQTSNALDIVLRHCRAVFDVHVANNLDIYVTLFMFRRDERW